MPEAGRGRYPPLALRPLPARPYEYAEWRKALVNIDYHVAVDRESAWRENHRLQARLRNAKLRLTATVRIPTIPPGDSEGKRHMVPKESVR